MINNYFYDLPIELIKNIYEYDKTYRDNYNKVIEIINSFPKLIDFEDYIPCNNPKMNFLIPISYKINYKKDEVLIFHIYSNTIGNATWFSILNNWKQNRKKDILNYEKIINKYSSKSIITCDILF